VIPCDYYDLFRTPIAKYQEEVGNKKTKTKNKKRSRGKKERRL
jgi:hypothetical protein